MSPCDPIVPPPTPTRSSLVVAPTEKQQMSIFLTYGSRFLHMVYINVYLQDYNVIIMLIKYNINLLKYELEAEIIEYHTHSLFNQLVIFLFNDCGVVHIVKQLKQS